MISDTETFLTNMLNSPKHKGDMVSLVNFLGECREYSLKNYKEVSERAPK